MSNLIRILIMHFRHFLEQKNVWYCPEELIYSHSQVNFWKNQSRIYKKKKYLQTSSGFKKTIKQQNLNSGSPEGENCNTLRLGMLIWLYSINPFNFETHTHGLQSCLFPSVWGLVSPSYGCIRMAPSKRITSPLIMGFSAMEVTRWANSAGSPRRDGKGTCRARKLCTFSGRPASRGVENRPAVWKKGMKRNVWWVW